MCGGEQFEWGNKRDVEPPPTSFHIQSAGILFCNNGVELLTFNADRGRHFTGDLTEQLDQEECGQMELGWIVNISLSTSQLSKFYNPGGFLHSTRNRHYKQKLPALKNPHKGTKTTTKVSTQSLVSASSEKERTKVRTGCNKAVCPLLRNEM